MTWLMEISRICLEIQMLLSITCKVFNIAKTLKHDSYQCRLASMVLKFLVSLLLHTYVQSP